MKKRTALIVLLLLAVAAVFAGCSAPRDNGGEEHVHRYQKISDSATCLGPGERVDICLTCKHERRAPSSALGHSYAVTEHRDETCIADGIHVETCARCGARTERTMAATGHTFVLDTVTTASCEQGGERIEKCSSCGEEKKTAFSATAHELVHYDAKAPTCTEGGYNAYDACENCGYTTYAVQGPLGHDKVTHEEKASTCSIPGNDAYDTCSRCDYTTYKALPLNDTHTYRNGVCTGCKRAEPILFGKWRFNDVINFDALNKTGEIKETWNVNFSIEEPKNPLFPNYTEQVQYSSLTVVGVRQYSVPDDVFVSTMIGMDYDDTEAAGFLGGWFEEYYKTLDFGSEYQEINATFYDWFVSNATRVVE